MRNDNGVFSTLMENMFSNNIQQEEQCEKCSYEGEGENKRIRNVMVSLGLSAFIIMHISRWGEDKRQLKVLLASVTNVPWRKINDLKKWS